MMYFNIITIFYITTLFKTMSFVDPPTLFGMDEKMDKLVIKNQIAYHFKKVVKEVNQELFVSRKIDVSLLFIGIDVLKKTETEIRRLSDRIPDKIKGAVMQQDITGTKPVLEPYTLISDPYHTSFKEAKAKCAALGMQLPEVYTIQQKETLTTFLSQRSVTHCFAGIEHDMVDSIQRHIATQYPIWKTGYQSLHNLFTGVQSDLKYSLDDAHARFAYTSKGTLGVSTDSNTIIDAGQLGSHKFRENNHELSQLMSRVVCEPKWDGSKHTVTLLDKMNKGGINVVTRYHRSIDTNKKSENTSLSDMKSIQTLCHSIADHAKESHTEMHSKLKDLLSLVDISVHDTITTNSRRKKRIPIFIAKFVFVTGVKLLWQLFGFVQKVKMNNRLKNLESKLQTVDNRSQQNSEAIQNMTRLICGNSVAIGQLSIRVDNLEIRLTLIEKQVETLWEKFSSLSYKFEAVNSLMIIENLISRTRQSMESGYTMLKDIIHHTKLGQTSPLVLPLNQIELVQNEISRSSTATLDPDFAKMQSIVVSDPNDPSLLLVVVNMAALSRRSLELVKMVPIPYFEDKNAYEVSLDYNTIVLDQTTHTFSILTEQEEYDCMFNRCYVGSSEQSLLERSCGIPQFYDRHVDGCVAESVLTTGVYLKPMLPDGVIFALNGEVQSQVFCKDKPKGQPRKLKGTGILQLPNGCILSVLDSNGKVTKVKGQPQYTLVTADDLELMPGGLLTALQTEVNTNNTQKVASVNAFVERHVSSVVRQVESIDDKIEKQHTHVWSLTAFILMIILSIIITVYLMYCYSNRVRNKIRHLKDNFGEVTHHFGELTHQILKPVTGDRAETEKGEGALQLSPARKRDIIKRYLHQHKSEESGLPHSPRRKRDVVRDYLREHRERIKLLAEAQENLERQHEIDVEAMKEGSYISLSEISKSDSVERYVPSSQVMSSFRPIQSPRLINREYPRITPLVTEAQDYERDRLNRETELSQEFCEVTSPKLMSKMTH